ncbi:MAG: VRR-NUC domain-containing protein [Rhodospirillaceae bacterium]|nr:VRR-NUC domain-containing protein [Rhodospirillaceae bacterium]
MASKGSVIPASALSGWKNEAAFQRAVIDLCTALGWRHYHTHDSRRCVPGFPDLVLVRPPRVIFAELKMQRGRVSIHQQGWLRALSQCDGVEAVLWRDNMWDSIVQCLT